MSSVRAILAGMLLGALVSLAAEESVPHHGNVRPYPSRGLHMPKAEYAGSLTWLPFFEASATAGNYWDWSARHVDYSQGTAGNRPTWTAGGWYAFDGSDIITSTTNGFTTTTGTIMGWVNLTADGGFFPTLWSLCYGDNATHYSFVTFRITQATSYDVVQLIVSVDDVTKLNIHTPVNSSDAFVSAWHHMAVVQGGGTDQYLYIDGIQQTKTEITTTDRAAWWDDVRGGTYKGNLTTVGALKFKNANTNWLNGAVDDVRVFNFALTSNQVWTVYTRGAK